MFTIFYYQFWNDNFKNSSFWLTGLILVELINIKLVIEKSILFHEKLTSEFVQFVYGIHACEHVAVVEVRAISGYSGKKVSLSACFCQCRFDVLIFILTA